MIKAKKNKSEMDCFKKISEFFRNNNFLELKHHKLLILMNILLLSVFVRAENLIVNGQFDTGAMTFPEFWTPSSSKDVVYNNSDGPDGKASIAFFPGKGGTLRQFGLILVAGEKYRLSGYYKTRNFEAARSWVVIHSDDGWLSDTGVRSFKANADWILFEKTFTAFASETGRYGVAISIKDIKGEIQFADLKLEALTEKGIKGSSSALVFVQIGRLTPMQPLLNHIPREKAELTLRCLDKLPEPYTEYDVVCNNPMQKISLNQDGIVKLDLKGLNLGDHQLQVGLIERKNGQKVFDSNYTITIVPRTEIDSTNHKVMNNLVTEILNRPVAPELQFSNPREGWVFIGVPSGTIVKLDGYELYLPTDRAETVAFLTAGLHTLNIAGIPKNGNVVVRSIPEILNYPPFSDSAVKGNGSYGWNFMKKHVNYALITLNGGILNPGKEISDEIKKLGFIWLTNNAVAKYPSSEWQQKLQSDPGLNDAQFAGLTVDEFSFSDATLLNSYSQTIRKIHNDNNRLIYTWIVGKPSMWLHCDFISTAVNVSRGRGKLLYEVYCKTLADEKAAQDYLNEFLVDTVRKINVFYPQVNPNIGMVLGNFNQIPLISLDSHTEVDYKYYLDMQLNTIANQAEFKNLGLVGYWGSYYGDEELYRWSFKLMRHYAVEGKKNLLSAEYGFKYNPGLLKNGDFAFGLADWRADGTITTDALPNYAKVNQRRSYVKIGDSFAKFTRSGQCNKLTQMAKNLLPGKLYCLKFAVADYNDVKNKIINPRLLGLDVNLPGASIIKDKSFVYVDDRKNKNLKFGRINFHRVVFRIAATEQPVIFSDEQATPGQELILNYVKLTPYFED